MSGRISRSTRVCMCVCVASHVEIAASPVFSKPTLHSPYLTAASGTMLSSSSMASSRVAPITAQVPFSSASSWTPEASSLAFRPAGSAFPTRQAPNGELNVRASSEGQCSRRKAMALAGGVAIDGLFLLLSARSAEARTVNSGVRKKMRNAIEELKEKSQKATEEAKKNVQDNANKVLNKVAEK